ncbi:hypothetical protein [Pseudomonas veronii]|uniref:hypothetical protein n=1 Tax=Pseudomonas veronii TaxID=76761 RepID=UPI0009A4C2D1|nr:hypothetical protein [Pseudomonas veronii]AQY65699.1 hypothetical protein PverR02_11805 [Pseudomonas veronii]
MPTEYSLSDVLERLHQNQLTLEVAVMKLTLREEHQKGKDTGDYVRGALHTIGKIVGYIKQGLAKLRAEGPR